MRPDDSHLPTTIEAAMRDFGARLAALRLSRNLTQADLAREAVTSPATIKRLEAGQNVSLDAVVRVLSAFGMRNRLSESLPNPEVRPIERVRHKGHERQRARGKAKTAKATEWAWGEEEGE